MSGDKTGTPRTQSLGRAVVLLQAVGAEAGGGSASALARATGLPRSTVTRTLRTLADVGFVDEVAGGWRLGSELVRLARAADPHRAIVEAATSPLARLRDDVEESALLAVPQGRPGMEIVLQLDPERHIGVTRWVGAGVELHASAAGKLILADLAADELDDWLRHATLVAHTEKTLDAPDALRAELDRVRRRGWAELVDELEDGLASISVPVRAGDAQLVGVVGLSAPTFRLGRARRREVLPRVRAAATEIEVALRR